MFCLMGGTISTLTFEVILYLSTAAAEFLRHFDVTKFDRSKFFCHIAFFCTFCIAIKNVIPNKMTYIHTLDKLESKNWQVLLDMGLSQQHCMTKEFLEHI